jgi:hypothetical protein
VALRALLAAVLVLGCVGAPIAGASSFFSVDAVSHNIYNLTAQPQGGSAVLLTWTQNESGVNYDEVQVYSNLTCAGEPVQVIHVTLVAYGIFLNGLPAEKAYGFNAYAVIGNTPGPASNCANTTAINGGGFGGGGGGIWSGGLDGFYLFLGALTGVGLILLMVYWRYQDRDERGDMGTTL